VGRCDPAGSPASAAPPPAPGRPAETGPRGSGRPTRAPPRSRPAEEFTGLYNGSIEASLRQIAYGSAAPGAAGRPRASAVPPGRRGAGDADPDAGRAASTTTPPPSSPAVRPLPARDASPDVVPPPGLMRKPGRLKSAARKGARKGSAEPGERDAGPRPASNPKPKQARKWEHDKDAELETLDLGGAGAGGGGGGGSGGTDVGGGQRSGALGAGDSSSDDEEPAPSGFLGALAARLSTQIVGKSQLSEADVAPALAAIRGRLTERNVAQDVADQVVGSVGRSLVGTRLAAATRISTVVRAAFREALERILTPSRPVDILRDVREAQRRGDPYMMVFVGVNGVGKSTNLAKVAYWLLQSGHSVMVAGCDTFRSGAVEQLRTHCTRLGVPLFEQGYSKDPAEVAAAAYKAAQRQRTDVLLVDTAGRMQDNEPLMREVASLLNRNRPDLTVFVGEALVGNDAVDQLSKFNRRLTDLSTAGKARAIDGLLLTKFDTIDTKVGAALSMVSTSGAPVLFVGVGQGYPDLRRFNVGTVVDTLLR